MSSTSAFLYPACYLKSRAAAAISLFLDQILVLAPSEDSTEMVGPGQEISSMKISPMLPSSLGEKLGDFKNALKALETWGEQIGLGGNMGFETLYSALSSSGNEDIQGIIGAIKGGKKEDILMASRFFLRLSMDADQKMDEMERELERVEMDKNRISEIIEGLSSSGKETAGGSTYFLEPLNRSRERLRAWTRTFFAGEGQAEKSWPLGESISVKDLMDSAYESLSGGRSPLEVADFSIPFHPAKLCREDAVSDIRPLFSRLLEMLAGKTGKDAAETTGSQEITDVVRDIQNTIDVNCRSDNGEGSASMVVTVYPGCSWQEVLFKASQVTDIDINKSPTRTIWGSLFVV
jgi:hypothetical protein